MKAAWIALLFFFLTQGCVTEHTVRVAPGSNLRNRAMSSDDQKTALVIRARGNSQGRLWYRNRFHSWVLEEEPMGMVMDALEWELRSLGWVVARETHTLMPRLDVELRWFGPYGHSPLTSAVIIAFALYPAESEKPVWRGRVQAGETAGEEMVHPGNETTVMGEMISKTLDDAVGQLKWKQGFLEAVWRLSSGADKPIGEQDAQ